VSFLLYDETRLVQARDFVRRIERIHRDLVGSRLSGVQTGNEVTERPSIAQRQLGYPRSTSFDDCGDLESAGIPESRWLEGVLQPSHPDSFLNMLHFLFWQHIRCGLRPLHELKLLVCVIQRALAPFLPGVGVRNEHLAIPVRDYFITEPLFVQAQFHPAQQENEPDALFRQGIGVIQCSHKPLTCSVRYSFH
jgi:hypothetical protein